jgi:hypothetical protein
MVVVVALSGGCGGGSAPAAEFVQQADALHATLAPATTGGDADLSSYVQSVGRRVVDAAKAAAPQKAKNPVVDSMQFHLVRCAVPNVISTGGRHVYVYTALLAKCETEDDLAAALCLPVAHALDLDLQASGLPKPNPKGDADRIVASLMGVKFSPAQNDEALKVAAAVYAKGGWDPARFAPALSSFGLTSAPQPPRSSRKPPLADEISFIELRDRAASAPPPDASTTQYLLALPNVFSPVPTPDQEASRKAILIRVTPPETTFKDAV